MNDMVMFTPISILTAKIDKRKKIREEANKSAKEVLEKSLGKKIDNWIDLSYNFFLLIGLIF